MNTEQRDRALEVIAFRWSNGETATMHLHHTNNQITALIFE